ncbi:MAG: alanyl-tRNA editing protein [Oscillospiraceae bacterium]|nr:alanyl-tRNA editing protein [Oscillospiraceae bacterium]
MEVRKLFYEDSQLHTFTATVTGCTTAKGGYAVTLDATAFYPEGGGQACDTGMLADVRVLSVKEQGQNIIHLCSAPLEVGAEVTGTVDWDRRFDLMQQHTGEHMVSGVIYQTYGFHNVGFHMGAELVTIDFDGFLPPEALERIEDAVNRAIWQDLPIRCWYPEPEELPRVPYRRKKDLPWPVRIVQIPGIDTCACCGTQMKRTGQVGLVKLFSCVKFHQGVRIEMAAGKRALDILCRTYQQNKLVSQAFSAKLFETGQAAQRMNETLSAEKFRVTALEKRIFSQIAKDYAGRSLAVHFEDSLTPGSLRELADTMAETCETAVALSGNDVSGYGICIISRHCDVRPIGAAAVAALRGRGGGKPAAFQGSVCATREEIDAYFAAV